MTTEDTTSNLRISLEHAADLAGEIVCAYAGHVPAKEIPAVISSILGAFGHDGASPLPAPSPLVPAIPVKHSVRPDYIVCLEDGKRFKSLKRHLGALGMTPDQYRTKWGLPSDYPMVAPNYSEVRSELAKANGLGRK